MPELNAPSRYVVELSEVRLFNRGGLRQRLTGALRSRMLPGGGGGDDRDRDRSRRSRGRRVQVPERYGLPEGIPTSRATRRSVRDRKPSVNRLGGSQIRRPLGATRPRPSAPGPTPLRGVGSDSLRDRSSLPRRRGVPSTPGSGEGAGVKGSNIDGIAPRPEDYTNTAYRQWYHKRRNEQLKNQLGGQWAFVNGRPVFIADKNASSSSGGDSATPTPDAPPGLNQTGWRRRTGMSTPRSVQQTTFGQAHSTSRVPSTPGRTLQSIAERSTKKQTKGEEKAASRAEKVRAEAVSPSVPGATPEESQVLTRDDPIPEDPASKVPQKLLKPPAPEVPPQRKLAEAKAAGGAPDAPPPPPVTDQEISRRAMELVETPLEYHDGGRDVRRRPRIADLEKKLADLLGGEDPFPEGDAARDFEKEVKALNLAIANMQRPRTPSRPPRKGPAPDHISKQAEKIDALTIETPRADLQAAADKAAAANLPVGKEKEFPLNKVSEIREAPGTQGFVRAVEDYAAKLVATDVPREGLLKWRQDVLETSLADATPEQRNATRMKLNALQMALDSPGKAAEAIAQRPQKPKRLPFARVDVPKPEVLHDVNFRKDFGNKSDAVLRKARAENAKKWLSAPDGPDKVATGQLLNSLTDELNRRAVASEKAEELGKIPQNIRNLMADTFITVEGLSRFEGYSHDRAIARTSRIKGVPENLVRKNWTTVKDNLDDFRTELDSTSYFPDDDKFFEMHRVGRTWRHMLRSEEDYDKFFTDEDDIRQSQTETEEEFEQRVEKQIEFLIRNGADADEMRKFLDSQDREVQRDPIELEQLNTRRRFPASRGMAMVPEDLFKPLEEGQDPWSSKNRVRSAVLMTVMRQRGIPIWNSSIRMRSLLGGDLERKEMGGPESRTRAKTVNIESPLHIENYNHPRFRRNYMRDVLRGRQGTPQEQQMLREVVTELGLDPRDETLFQPPGRVPRFNNPRLAARYWRQQASPLLRRLHRSIRSDLQTYADIKPDQWKMIDEKIKGPDGETLTRRVPEPPGTVAPSTQLGNIGRAVDPQKSLEANRTRIQSMGELEVPEEFAPGAPGVGNESIAFVGSRRMGLDDSLDAEALGYRMAQLNRPLDAGGTIGNYPFIKGVVAAQSGQVTVHTADKQQTQEIVQQLTRDFGGRAPWAEYVKFDELNIQFDDDDARTPWGPDMPYWEKASELHANWDSLSQDARRGVASAVKLASKNKDSNFIIIDRPGNTSAQRNAQQFGAVAQVKRALEQERGDTYRFDWNIREDPKTLQALGTWAGRAFPGDDDDNLREPSAPGDLKDPGPEDDRPLPEDPFSGVLPGVTKEDFPEPPVPDDPDDLPREPGRTPDPEVPDFLNDDPESGPPADFFDAPLQPRDRDVSTSPEAPEAGRPSPRSLPRSRSAAADGQPDSRARMRARYGDNDPPPEDLPGGDSHNLKTSMLVYLEKRAREMGRISEAQSLQQLLASRRQVVTPEGIGPHRIPAAAEADIPKSWVGRPKEWFERNLRKSVMDYSTPSLTDAERAKMATRIGQLKKGVELASPAGPEGYKGAPVGNKDIPNLSTQHLVSMLSQADRPEIRPLVAALRRELNARKEVRTPDGILPKDIQPAPGGSAASRVRSRQEALELLRGNIRDYSDPFRSDANKAQIATDIAGLKNYLAVSDQARARQRAEAAAAQIDRLSHRQILRYIGNGSAEEQRVGREEIQSRINRFPEGTFELPEPEPVTEIPYDPDTGEIVSAEQALKEYRESLHGMLGAQYPDHLQRGRFQRASQVLAQLLQIHNEEAPDDPISLVPIQDDMRGHFRSGPPEVGVPRRSGRPLQGGSSPGDRRLSEGPRPPRGPWRGWGPEPDDWDPNEPLPATPEEPRVAGFDETWMGWSRGTRPENWDPSLPGAWTPEADVFTPAIDGVPPGSTFEQTQPQVDYMSPVDVRQASLEDIVNHVKQMQERNGLENLSGIGNTGLAIKELVRREADDLEMPLRHHAYRNLLRDEKFVRERLDDLFLSNNPDDILESSSLVHELSRLKDEIRFSEDALVKDRIALTKKALRSAGIRLGTRAQAERFYDAHFVSPEEISEELSPNLTQYEIYEGIEKGREVFLQAATFFPKSWWDRLDSQGYRIAPFVPPTDSTDDFWTLGEGTAGAFLNVNENAGILMFREPSRELDLSYAVHEMMHMMSHAMPSLGQTEGSFVFDMASPGVGTWLNMPEDRMGISSRWDGLEVNFPPGSKPPMAYMGKVYTPRGGENPDAPRADWGFEANTSLMESLFFGTADPYETDALEGKVVPDFLDPDYDSYWHYILGILARLGG